jgi:hypothetical protein
MLDGHSTGKRKELAKIAGVSERAIKNQKLGKN